MSAASPLLSGTHGPVSDESVFEDLEVIGELPKDLNGAFFRNGPNAHFPQPGRYHWFDGDGMLHAAYFDRGRVTYRNRYVRTNCFREEEAAGRALWSGIMDPPRADRPDMPLKDTSNTDVKFHAGRLVTLWYLAGQPYHVDPWTLETIGPADFKGTLHTHVSAHSKVDEQADEFLYFDYTKAWPYMSFGIAGPRRRGPQDRERRAAGPEPAARHGASRRNTSILHDLSLTYDPQAYAAGRHKLRFFGDRPARFAVIPRDGIRARRPLVRGRALLHLPRRQRLGRRRRGRDGRLPLQHAARPVRAPPTNCATPRPSRTCRWTPACTSGASTCAPARRASA